MREISLELFSIDATTSVIFKMRAHVSMQHILKFETFTEVPFTTGVPFDD